MPRTPQSLQRILANDPLLGPWNARRHREATLTGIVRRHLPRPLAERVHVNDVQGTELVLAAEAGAIAAVVKQRSPDLIAALQREGCQFSVIRVRVQVRTVLEPPPKTNIKQMDRSCFQPLARLARELPGGPLKAALTRFVRRAG
jgi:hypothetical protein